MNARIADSRGFTLLELQVAQLIGGFVIAAAISMMIIAINSASRVTDRVNAAQVGRVAMEQIQQRMRSETCLYPGEFTINGGTGTTGAQASLIHAGPNKLVYFGDVGATGGSSGVTGSVGFQPQIRYLYLVTDPTGRRGTLVEGWRKSSTTTTPFNYSITPATSLPSLAAATTITTVPPNTFRAMGTGVGWMVADTAPLGATSPTVPLFRYYDANGVEIPISATIGAVDPAQFGTIDKVTVGFKVFGLTAKDQAGPTNPLDRRYATFRDDIYLHSIVDRCQ